jgi:hypothetical protein
MIMGKGADIVTKITTSPFHDASGNLLPHSHWKGVTTSEHSAIEKIDFRVNALSFFFRRGFEDDIGGFPHHGCVPDIIPGIRSNDHHHFWHAGTSDFDLTHFHLVRTYFDLFRPEDLTCLLSNVKNLEKTMQKCLDGKTDCYLTEDDLEKAQKAYQVFYDANIEGRKKLISDLKDQVRQTQIEAQASVQARLHDIYRQTALIFIHGFLKTILKDYLRLYLIGENFDPKKIDRLMTAMDATITLALSFSVLSVGFELITIKIVRPALIRQNILPPLTIDLICQALTVVSYIKNPLSLAQLGLGNMFALEGQLTAWLIMEFLPKIKKVKQEEAELAEIKEEVINKHPTTRRRK